MKKIIIVLLGFILSIFGPLSAQAGVVKIINKTTSEIHAIYISSSSAQTWEENIIEGSYLPPGHELDIKIPNYKAFDLRIEDDEENYEDYTDFPGSTKEIELHGGGDASYG